MKIEHPWRAIIRSSLLTAVMSCSMGAGSLRASPAGTSFGTTVISHGYQFSGTLPAWPETLARAIRSRAGGGRVFRYLPATGELELVAGTADEVGETILVFDWAIESNDRADGRSEAAAEALLAALLSHSQGPSPLIPLGPLHLIGHSRGAVVNSEVAERLVAQGLPVDHVTTLDPHDWGTAGVSSAPPDQTDWDVNTWHPEYPDYDIFGQPPGIQTWQGVVFADNYYQQLGSEESLLNPWGKPLPGAANLYFPDSFVIDHSAAHAWYHGTVDTAAANDGTGIHIPDAWYDNPGGHEVCDQSARNWTLERSAEGFWFSLLGGWTGNQCPQSEYAPGLTRVPVRFSYGLPEGIVNGDFERGISGWSFHGGEIGPGVAVGNGVLDLNLGIGDESVARARHNRFFIPADRSHIRLCLRVVSSDPDDIFRVTIGSSIELARNVSRVTASCEEITLPLDSYRDTVQTLSLELVATGSGSARVFVDNVVFLPTELILLDGFESGDTSAWSSSVP